MGAALGGCATESHQSVAIQQVAAASKPYAGPRFPVAVGKFDNRSSFMRGLFSDGVDRLGSQAKTILITHLQQTNRFTVLDRENLAEARQEAGIKQQALKLKGADYIVTGDVTEFGRKEVGDHQLFGILGRGKQQVFAAHHVGDVLGCIVHHHGQLVGPQAVCAAQHKVAHRAGHMLRLGAEAAVCPTHCAICY